MNFWHQKMMYRQKNSGFLLIELLISITIISLVVSFGILTVGHFHKALVRADVEKLYATCRYLQQCAIVTNQKQILTFDTIRNSYHYHNHEERLSPYTIFGIKNSTIKGPPSAPTNSINNPITFIGKRITFSPTGILQPGTIYVTDKNKQYQYALTVPVSQLSFLRKYHYSGSWNYIS